MPLPKLLLSPDQGGYSFTDSTDTVATKLDGGRSRVRRDIIGGVATVNLTWSMKRSEFQYLRAFFNTTLQDGALPFLMDLYMDTGELTEHECVFMPGTFGLRSVRGFSFTVSGTIEAKPSAADAELDAALVELYEAYGDLDLVYDVANQLEVLNNIDLPAAIGP
jgi:hypothetical protein